MKTFSGCLVLVGLVLLQRVEAQAPKAETPAATPAAQGQPLEDPLGRSTPRGTVNGLVDATQRGNLERAAQYLDSRLGARDRQDLAFELGVVLDRKLRTDLARLSNKPDGNLDDGLTNRDRVGLVVSESGNVEIVLDRVQRGQDLPVWLFSSSILEDIPRLYGEAQPLWIERNVPERLRTIEWFSIPLYRWILILLLIPAIFGVATLATRVLGLVLRPLLKRFAPEKYDRALASRGPLRLLVLAWVFYAVAPFTITLGARRFWSGVAETLTVIALCWLALRLMDLVADGVLKRLGRVNLLGETALVRLSLRVSKAAAAIVGGMVLLFLWGVDFTAVLAGLGVGGLAIGFGAQKTIENLFGGIMVISDRPVAVGDACRVGEFQGTVEDIGLRSTRIRTLDRTVVSIPNGQLSNMSLENLAVRDRFWLHHTIGLRTETTADQMRVVLTGIRRLLEGHPKVAASSARARFIRFSSASLDLEIAADVLETDALVFLAVQEEVLLAIMDIVDRSGTSLASPIRAGNLAAG